MPKNLKLYYTIFAAILYGFSFPIFPNLNLSILVFFGFAIFFNQIKNIQTFHKYYLYVFLFLYIAHFIAFWWVFNIPINRALVFFATIQDTLFVSLSYVILYLIKRKFAYKKSLIIVAFFIPFWEWIYTELENTIGFMNIGYTQAGNKYLLQLAEFGGVYLTSFMVWIISVIILRIYLKINVRNYLIQNVLILVCIISFTVGFFHLRNNTKMEVCEIDVLISNPHYAPIKMNESYWDDVFNEMLNETDSVIKQSDLQARLIIWPESMVNEGWNEKKDILRKKNYDWQTPILLGIKYRDNNKIHNSIVSIDSVSMQRYDKIKLTPFWEGIPFLSHYFYFKNFISPGQKFSVFDFDELKFGTPVCFEMLYPSVWRNMAKNGAQFFIHSSYESWLGKNWFQNVFVGITKFRSVENFATIIRCSNGGPSGIIYPNKNSIISTTTFAFFKTEIVTQKSTVFQKIYYFIPIISLILFGLAYYYFSRKVL